jgi:hypothetical protein
MEGVLPEYLASLEEGSHMNFLKEPKHEIHDKAHIDEEQLDVAAAFIDTLHNLGIVVLESEEGQEVISKAPFFMVPKEGQEGQ